MNKLCRRLCNMPNLVSTSRSFSSYTPDLDNLDYKDFSKFLALEDGDKAIVIKVYDGDTLTIGFRHGSSQKPVRESVRIRGIDTPELRTSSEEEKQLAFLARSRLAEATLRDVVTLISPESDKYGRLLCDLKTNRYESIAAHMLEAENMCREYNGGKKQPWPRKD